MTKENQIIKQKNVNQHTSILRKDGIIQDLEAQIISLRQSSYDQESVLKQGYNSLKQDLVQIQEMMKVQEVEKLSLKNELVKLEGL